MTLSQRAAVAPDAENTQDTAVEEQKPRFSHRKRAASAGLIYANEINGVVHCVVRDMSVTGARLLIKASKLVTEADGKLGLPSDFTLNIKLDRIAVNCRVVWNEGDEVGVRFTSTPRVLERPMR